MSALSDTYSPMPQLCVAKLVCDSIVDMETTLKTNTIIVQYVRLSVSQKIPNTTFCNDLLVWH